MKRYDLRGLGADFDRRMLEILASQESGSVTIFLFEVGDFSSIQRSADLVKEQGCTLINSLKFNEVDWTIVVQK